MNCEQDAGCEIHDAGMSYRDLEIWKLAPQKAAAVHRMTLQDPPKFETYEEGSQIRRSAKSASANILEGYGRRRYKQEFIRFLGFAHASCDETIDHLEVLFETGSLTNEVVYPGSRIAHLAS
jgi:four helix bundle protein